MSSFPNNNNLFFQDDKRAASGFAGLPNAAPPNSSQQEDFLRNLGFNVDGGRVTPGANAFGNRGLFGNAARLGAPFGNSTSTSVSRAFSVLGGGGGTSFLDQLTGALGQEITQQQEIIDRSNQERRQQIEGFEEVFGGFDDLSRAIDEGGAAIESRADESLSRLEGRIAEVEGGLVDRTAGIQSDMTAGLERRAKTAMDAITSNPNLTMQEKNDLVGRQKQALLNDVGASFRQLQEGFQRLKAEQATQLTGVLAGGLSERNRATEMAQQFLTANKLNALQAELQGRLGYSEFLRNNPESMLSRFQALVALGQVALSPGGRSARGLNLSA